MATAQDIIGSAYKDLNITENPPGSNHITLHDGTDLWANIPGGQEGWPYCDGWVSWILHVNGLVPANVPWFVGVPAMHQWYAKQGWTVHDPQPGDICCFHFSSDDQHTGFVVENLGNGYIKTIEANTSKEGDASGSQSDGGGVFERHRAINSVDAFLRPPYSIPQPSAGPVGWDGTVSKLAFPDGSGGWYLHADGGVFTFGKAPFYGSYPGLPESARQGDRTFTSIEPRGDGKPGYVLVSNHGERYTFPYGT